MNVRYTCDQTWVFLNSLGNIQPSSLCNHGAWVKSLLQDYNSGEHISNNSTFTLTLIGSSHRRFIYCVAICNRLQATTSYPKKNIIDLLINSDTQIYKAHLIHLPVKIGWCFEYCNCVFNDPDIRILQIT